MPRKSQMDRVKPYPIEERQEQLASLAGILLERAGKEQLTGDMYEFNTGWLHVSDGKEIKVCYTDFDSDTARLDISTHTEDTVGGVTTNTIAIRNNRRDTMFDGHIPDGIENLTVLVASAIANQALNYK